jgi:hypothetical protein
MMSEMEMFRQLALALNVEQLSQDFDGFFD